MSPRFVPSELLPHTYAGLARASKPPEGPVPEATLELVKIRVSQLNGCAFCCDLHGRHAAAAGVDEVVLRALPGWRELPELSELDRAALAVAESLGELGAGDALEAAMDAGLAALGEQGFAQVVAAVAAISAWNRVMRASGTPPDVSYG